MNGLAICAGVAGIELGLSLVEPGYKTICYVEREAYTAAVLVKRMEETFLDEAPVWDDVKTFMGVAWRGKVDIITAGFPCQPWSHAGQRKGTEDERWIWPDIARVIGEVRPRYVFLENVPGLFSWIDTSPRPAPPETRVDGNRWRVEFEQRQGVAGILGDLAEIGYDAEWTHLSAADVGANHRRERAWILAYADSSRSLQRESKISPTEGRQPSLSGSTKCSQDVEDTRHRRRRPVWLIKGGNNSQRKRPANNSEITGPSADVAYAKCGGLEESRQFRKGPRKSDFSGRSQNGAQLANSNGAGLKTGGPALPQGWQEEEPMFRGPGEPESGNGWWDVEPPLGRVVNEFPYRVDRIRACGGGVVPLVAATAYTLLKGRIGGV